MTDSLDLFSDVKKTICDREKATLQELKEILNVRTKQEERQLLSVLNSLMCLKQMHLVEFGGKEYFWKCYEDDGYVKRSKLSLLRVLRKELKKETPENVRKMIERKIGELCE